MTLYERIQTALARPTGRVLITTYTRSTTYTPKHASLFIAPRNQDDLGVYVMNGKRKNYVFPGYVRIGHVQKVR
jgi:hypothetical protein